MRARKEPLERIAHSGSERADRVLKAKELLAVMAGYSFRESARQAGCRFRNSVSQLVVNFTSTLSDQETGSYECHLI